MEPFLRWAGGKSWLIKHLEEIIGELEINHYHEPFLGGGAIFFSTGHRLRSYLSDVNEDLIRTYIAVRDVPNEVIHFFEQFQNTEEQYYFIRAQRYNNPAQCAAQFIFLNQMSFNGIYRVNANGQYNVPYGFRVGHEYDVQRILGASAALRNTNIKYGDFELNKYIMSYDYQNPEFTQQIDVFAADEETMRAEGSISKLGILHLPKRYRSAYIIDGQHRLYGYSDSPYAKTNSIPVVAFVDLDRQEQIKLFMDINENQKSVPKTLRVTLNADIKSLI